mmetsp:Transcript_20408/g.29240  ORF Transcript_20408/g.29240 Transcript_20408/m.29240 type:complete len:543 (+) Transcript_20408:93-1721(+)
MDPCKGVNEKNSVGKEVRRRTKTKRFDFEYLENEDHRLLQQAIKISCLETQRKEVVIPEAPTYYPTEEEFLDPIQYVNKIRAEAEQYGICKIVPPKNWDPKCNVSMSNPNKFPTKQQKINTLQEGQGFDDGNEYDIATYKQMADKFYTNWIQKYHHGKEMTIDEAIKDYWDLVETNTRSVAVEYGNDLDTNAYTSGFDPTADPPERTKFATKNDSHSIPEMNSKYYALSGWNLNNLPTADGSVLKYLRTPVNGVNVPWLYVGMLFSSFCWHNEDNYFYSINYSHFGAVKQWYGVPGAFANTFESVTKTFLLELFRESPDLLHHMTTQFSPSLLGANGVPIYKASQEAKTFMITFPKSYHCGFSHGFNVGEAVNFASIDWLLSGGEAEERYRHFGRGSVFSHQRLLFTLLEHRNELNPADMKCLANEILKVVNEEIQTRPMIQSQGIRDLSDVVKLPRNKFECIDSMGADYDDMRTCCICKHICVFTAIACECDKSKVTCIRHFNNMCKCAKDKKFMLTWASTDSLEAIRTDVTKYTTVDSSV